MVEFRPLNLLQEFGQLGAFDIVYCRNVLIYFDAATKTDVLRRLAAALNPDGAVLLGAAETVIGLSDALVSARRAPRPLRAGAQTGAARRRGSPPPADGAG